MEDYRWLWRNRSKKKATKKKRGGKERMNKRINKWNEFFSLSVAPLLQILEFHQKQLSESTKRRDEFLLSKQICKINSVGFSVSMCIKKLQLFFALGAKLNFQVVSFFSSSFFLTIKGKSLRKCRAHKRKMFNKNLIIPLLLKKLIRRCLKATRTALPDVQKKNLTYLETFC